MTTIHVKNNPNSSPLSPLSVNLKQKGNHHQEPPSTREEPPSDLFSPKGRRPRRRHSARHHRGDSSTRGVISSSSKYPKTPCPSPNYPAVKKKSIQPSIITNNKSRHHHAEPTMAVRLRRMKRRLLQEHINKSE